ncbi:MAG: ParB/RepB/Spo0J family partition protein [Planctomycetes bacterium]|jgi:ParB family chromosome partitioning protein|nr:ParB/RepB/Spo0J family partition protein [Planctomycetota bacterium]
MTQNRMGRGLRALMGAATPATEPTAGSHLPIDRIKPNPRQPRKVFDPQDLAELAQTIKDRGVLQPVVVHPIGNGDFELIAGERRWRASQLAGLQEIPVVVRQEVNEREMLILALVENVQRRDLDAIEKARGFAELASSGATQDEIASWVGMNRASIANFIRLLDLPEDVQQLVSRGHLKMGHARALLGLLDAEKQRRLAVEVVKKGLSVRQTEDMVQRLRPSGAPAIASADENAEAEVAPSSAAKARTDAGPVWVGSVEKRLRERFGLTVGIRHTPSGEGRLEFSYRSEDELQFLLEEFGVGEDQLPR